MNRSRQVYHAILIVFLILTGGNATARKAPALLSAGWAALVRDDDTAALRAFARGYLTARAEGDTAATADALLYMGICYYGVSYVQGYSYAVRAMDEYRKLEGAQPLKAQVGRSRCLQLMSTIKSRQGRYREAMALSREALAGFPPGPDTTGTVGLIYTSLGNASLKLGFKDSVAGYYRLALDAQLRSGNKAYLPAAYAKVAALEAANGHRQESNQLLARALRLADSTGNRQAQVLILLDMGEAAGDDRQRAEELYLRAVRLAGTLTDPAFRLQAAGHLQQLYTSMGDYRQAMAYQDSTIRLREQLNARDHEREVKSLEIQFEVAEKVRQLQLLQDEQRATRRVNYLLAGGLLLLALLATGAMLLLRRERQLVRVRAALAAAEAGQQRLLEEQQALRQQQLQRELEFRESQLSAMALQMLEKNELMQELRMRLEGNQVLAKDQQLVRLLGKGINRDKEWEDFSIQFESINRHFYQRLKQAYPAISPNDLRLCALIRLRLSIKEMAAILNISPDSVKTARYRLRKKLQLNTEDNLTGFIMDL